MITLGFAMVLAVVISACGSSSSSSSAGVASSTNAAATSGGSTISNSALPATPSDTTGANVAAAQKYILSALAASKKFVGPGSATVDVAKATKPIWYLQCGSVDPYCTAKGQAFATAAKAAGVKYKIYVAASTPQAVGAAIGTAVADGAGVIILDSIDTSSVLGPIKAAQAKGVKIMDETVSDSAAPLPAGLDAEITNSFVEEGKIGAAYAVAEYGAKTDAFCMNAPTYPVVQAVCDGFKSELASLCSQCKYRIGNFDVATLSTSVSPTVQAALRSDPDTDYIMCGFDALCDYAVPAIVSLGDAGKVTAGSQTGQVSPNLQWVQKGNVQMMDSGFSAGETSWAALDDAMRLDAGQAPVPNDGNLPLTVFTHGSMAGDAGDTFSYSTPGAEAKIFGQTNGDYEKVYESDWKKS